MEPLSHKLDYQMAGPYEVLKKIGNLYKIKLLDLIKIHFIFLLNKLWKTANNLLLKPKNKSLLPIQVNSNNKWEIKKILVYKFAKGTLKYYIN